MGGRFGKYGDAKRKALLRKIRFRPLDLRKRAMGKEFEKILKRKKRR